jgi:hypothetical protein
MRHASCARAFSSLVLSWCPSCLQSDGETFKLAHLETGTGTESFMTAQMVGLDEHWVGGTAQLGSKDAAAYVKKLLRPASRGRCSTREARLRSLTRVRYT